MKQTEAYKTENNIFQSLSWLDFQKVYGRRLAHFEDTTGIVLDLPFGKKGVWVQKGPVSISDFTFRASNLPKNTIFIRFEPERITEKEVSERKLRRVTKNSLLGGQASPRATRILDITKSEEDILAQMKPKTRYNIRLAEKKNIKIKMLDNENILYDLLLSTSKKGGGYFPHEKPYYTSLMKNLTKNNQAHVFVAEHQGDILSAIMVVFFGKTAIYLHGGQADVKKNLMSPYLCQWEAIRYAKNRGFEFYDFWGVAETDDPSDPWSGITKFKNGFGGERVIFPGTFDYVLNPFWYNVFTLLAKCKKILKL